MESDENTHIKISMDDFLHRIYDKQERLANEVHEINITLTKQEKSLEEHIRRTGALEELVVPLSTKSHQLEGILKFIGILGVLGSLAMAVSKLIQYLGH